MWDQKRVAVALFQTFAFVIVFTRYAHFGCDLLARRVVSMFRHLVVCLLVRTRHQKAVVEAFAYSTVRNVLLSAQRFLIDEVK